MGAARQFCTFWADGHFFGIAVDDVQEVIKYQEMTRVPLAPGVVQGLINLRGQIVTAIDLRVRLGLAPRAPGQRPTNVVLRTDDGAVSLLVDEIGDVVEVEDEQSERPPATLPRAMRELIDSVLKLERQLLLVLDWRRLLAIPELAQRLRCHAG